MAAYLTPHHSTLEIFKTLTFRFNPANNFSFKNVSTLIAIALITASVFNPNINYIVMKRNNLKPAP